MIFEWNETKNRVNKAKHHVSFEVAKLVFFDPYCLTLFDRVMDGEDRWHAIGLANGVLLVLVVHSARYNGREEIIEIISARRPTSRERRRYENGE
jgi:uncharacterized DUF497 family protein